jgi:hypothetical protein
MLQDLDEKLLLLVKEIRIHQDLERNLSSASEQFEISFRRKVSLSAENALMTSLISCDSLLAGTPRLQLLRPEKEVE